MTWRLADSLRTLRSQVDNRWPGRHKDSDGTIGDENHSSRTSDHNPNPAGVVCAIDITHDPRSGCDSYALAEVLRATRDPRISYVISNRKIFSSTVDAWQWRQYRGINPHDHHVHVSVKADKALYDSTAAWQLDAAPMPTPSGLAIQPPATLRLGDKGGEVETLQKILNTRGLPLKIDGQFGIFTQRAVRTFQSSRGLIADGVVGPQTWTGLTT